MLRELLHVGEEKKKEKQKRKTLPSPQVLTSFVLVSKESCIYNLFL